MNFAMYIPTIWNIKNRKFRKVAPEIHCFIEKAARARYAKYLYIVVISPILLVAIVFLFLWGTVERFLKPFFAVLFKPMNYFDEQFQEAMRESHATVSPQELRNRVEKETES